jgi:hypothetical protein
MGALNCGLLGSSANALDRSLLGSSVDVLDYIMVRLDRKFVCLIALTGTFKPHFHVNDLQHNKTLQLTKTLENN